MLKGTPPAPRPPAEPASTPRLAAPAWPPRTGGGRACSPPTNPPPGAAARALLEGQGVTVVGFATTSSEAVRSVQQLRPEVALVDIDLGADSGFELARQLADEVDGSAPRVILISTHDEREFVSLIESSPAEGFLAKTELSAERIHRLLDRAGG